MLDIGAQLRETRMRRRIDISEVEAATKIRAKYLRALENEEWSVLPGPTYVKTFLRTYAEFLGLDAHLLVDEYGARRIRPFRPYLGHEYINAGANEPIDADPTDGPVVGRRNGASVGLRYEF